MQQAQLQPENEAVALMRDLLTRLNSPAEDSLWRPDEIALYMNISKKSVQSHVVTKPGFPRPVILPTGGRRWVAKEVKAWALRHR